MTICDRLKGKMAERHCTAVELAFLLGRHPDYVRRYLYTPAQFRLKEVYKICKHLGIPREEIGIYFPEGGKYDSDRF